MNALNVTKFFAEEIGDFFSLDCIAGRNLILNGLADGGPWSVNGDRSFDAGLLRKFTGHPADIGHHPFLILRKGWIRGKNNIYGPKIRCTLTASPRPTGGHRADGGIDAVKAVF